MYGGVQKRRFVEESERGGKSTKVQKWGDLRTQCACTLSTNLQVGCFLLQ